MLTGIAFLLATASPAPAIPTPMGTPAPCNRPVAVLGFVTPDYPDAARDLHLGERTALIDVLVNANGKVAQERIQQSSGNSALDQASIAAAYQTTYSPKVVDCKPVEGHYLFKVTFDPSL